MCMEHYLSVIILVICLVSCNSHSEHWQTLSQVESYIEEKPDSALVALEQINLSELSGKEEKAKHALLYSMALDKNFIDKTDFKVLQPAVGYYEDNGTATDKMRTYYYQGRIYQNMGNEAQAMTCFLEAIEQGKDTKDVLTKARLLVAQSNIYYSLMKWNKVCETNLMAAEYFFERNKINSYVNCLLRVIGGYIQNDDCVKAKEYLDKCYQHMESIPKSLRSEIYAVHLLYLIKIRQLNEIPLIVNRYTNDVSEKDIDILTLAVAYTHIGEHNKAENVISQVNNNILDTNQKLKLFATLIEIYKTKGDYKTAMDYSIKFNELNDSIVFSIFENDTQFMAERHLLEMNAMKERESKHAIILWSLVFIIALITIIIYIRSRLKIRTMEQNHAKRAAEHYRLLYQQIEFEKENLTDLLSQNNDMDKNVKDIITRRIELLNKFFTVYITNNSEIGRKVDKELDELLANRDSFMSSTRLAFAGSHPNFIKYLEGHNLTEKEIEYCCLYALGLKGKEVGSYIKMRSHYNISSEVREKLGLAESDTNLGIYIRRLLTPSQ